jgi:hypothetical protein
MEQDPETVCDGGNGRAHDGRFGPGNTYGRGNPRLQHVGELRRAIAEAITPADIAAVVGALLTRARAGDVAAARELLDRVGGKPAQAPPEGEAISLSLPPLRSPADTVTASQAILAAVGAGTLSPADAARIAGVVELARRTLETEDLARRVALLESRETERAE